MNVKQAWVVTKSSRGKVNLLSIACVGALLVITNSHPAFGQQPPAAPKPPSSSAPQAPPAAPKSQSPAPASPGASPAAPDKASELKPDQVVLKIGDHQVTAADFEFALKNMSPQMQRQMLSQGRSAVVDQYVLLEVLAQQAVSQHLDDSPEFRRQMNLVRMRWLAQTEYRNIANEVKVTPEEISQYYSAHLSEFEEVVIRQVTVRKKPADAAESVPGLSADEAKAKAEAIRKALEAGADPKKVVEDFTMPNAVHIDPEPRTVRHGQLPKTQEAEVFKLKDGEFSPTTDEAQALSFTQLIKHQQAELKDVSKAIEAKLRDQKITEALNTLKKGAAVWMDPAYFGSASPSPAPPAASAPPASGTPPPAASKP